MLLSTKIFQTVPHRSATTTQIKISAFSLLTVKEYLLKDYIKNIYISIYNNFISES